MASIISSIALLFGALGFVAPSGIPFCPQSAQLAEGRKVFIKPSDKKELDMYLLKELQKWGRWKIVDDPTAAELFVQPKASGVTFWNSSAQCTIVDATSKEVLWISKPVGKSNWKSNAEQLVKQMKKDIDGGTRSKPATVSRYESPSIRSMS